MPRPGTRCNSCKQLKIGCDQRRPKCEYCIATNRECVYPVPKAKGIAGPISEQTTEQSIGEANTNNSKCNVAGNFIDDAFFVENVDLVTPSSDLTNATQFLLFTPSRDTQNELPECDDGDNVDEMGYNELILSPSNSQLRLNSFYKQLEISRFEYRLLAAYNQMLEKHLREEAGMDKPDRQIWLIETPKLWRYSMPVRQNIYCFMSMLLQTVSNFNELLLDDLFQEEINDRFSVPQWLQSDENLVFDTPFDQVKATSLQELDRRSLEFFDRSLKDTNRLINTVMDLEIDTATAFEVLVATGTIFSFLALHPYRVIPLVSFSADQTDMLHFAILTRSVEDKIMPVLIRSKYLGLYYSYDKILPQPLINEEYAITDELYQQFRIFETHNSNSEEDIRVIADSINWLKRCIYRAIEYDDITPVFRWIYFLELKMVDLMHQKHYFSLKILYYYSALSLLCGLVLYRDSNMLLDYIEWFSTYSGSSIYWRPFDQNLYQVVTSKTVIIVPQQLKLFNPADYI